MPPLLQNWNWSDLLYGLIPLLYILSQFLGAKEAKKEEGDSPEALQRKHDEEAALAERRRRIQEEIRRRITGEEQKTTPAPSPQSAARETPPARSLQNERPPIQAKPSRTATPTASAPQGGGYGSDIEARLARQKEALRRSQREHESARKQAAQMGAGIGLHPGTRQRASSSGAASTRKEVLTALGSAENIRAAIVLAEVLAPPVAQRPDIGERLF